MSSGKAPTQAAVILTGAQLRVIADALKRYTELTPADGVPLADKATADRAWFRIEEGREIAR